MKKLTAVLFSVFACSALACQGSEGDKKEGDWQYEKKTFFRVTPSMRQRYGSVLNKFYGCFTKNEKPSAGGLGASQRDAYRMSQIEMEDQ